MNVRPITLANFSFKIIYKVFTYNGHGFNQTHTEKVDIKGKVKGRKRKKRIQQIHEAFRGVLTRRMIKELEVKKALRTLRKDKNVVAILYIYILILIGINSSQSSFCLDDRICYLKLE